MKKHKYLNTLFQTYSTALLMALSLLFLIMLAFTYKEQYKKNIEVQQQLAARTQEQLDTSFQEMDRIINGLLFNKAFISIMEASDAQSHYTEYSRKVLSHFITLDAPLFSTYRIIAFNSDTYYTLTKTGENPSSIRKAADTYPWAELLLSSHGEKILLPVHPDSFDENGTIVYSAARLIHDGSRQFGMIEVQNEYTKIEKICSFGSASGQAVIFAPDGSIMYPYQPPEENLEFYQTLYRRISDAAFTSGSFRQDAAQISYASSEYSGWTTAVFTASSRFVPYALEMIIFSAGSFLLLAALSLSMLRLVTRKMAAPLTDLNHALSLVSLDNLSLTLPHSYNIEEIENINHSFQTMFGHLKEAIASNIQLKANEERANYLALESQMNPHTIYNTLSMIESVSYMNGDKEVSNLCICFSQMLRYISDYTRHDYTVRDEVQHLNNYAVLVQKRFADRLTILIDSEEDCMPQKLPKFTLQPLVENAVKHGFGAGYSMLTVQVSVNIFSGGWQITVSDDGCGFSVEALDLIRSQLEHCDRSLKADTDVLNMKIGRLALSNIYIRCRILYGNTFHMTVRNQECGNGGYVELTIYNG